MNKRAQKRNFFRMGKSEISEKTTDIGTKPVPQRTKKRVNRGGRARPKLPSLEQPKNKRPRFSSLNPEVQKNSILQLFSLKGNTRTSTNAGGNVNRASLFNIGRTVRKSQQNKGGVRRSTLALVNLFNKQEKKTRKGVKATPLDFDGDKWEIRQTINGRKYYWNKKENQHSWPKPEELMTEHEKQEMNKDWVWVPHPKNYWQPACIVAKKPNGGTQVRTMNQRLVTVPAIKLMKGDLTGGNTQRVPLTPLNYLALDTVVEDLVELDTVNDATVLHNLRMRYEKQQIYTWIGPSRNVLVAVNPYRDLGLYTEEFKKRFENSATALDTPKPHVFAVAAVCVHKLSTQGRSQSILVSGESGSGKTQATKQCLDFITHVAGSTKIMTTKKKKPKTVERAPGTAGRAGRARRARNRRNRQKRQMPGEGGIKMVNAGSENSIEDKILNCNPIMEAFGNAKTVRNNNSSRFGKWIVMYMNMKRKQVIGAKIDQFLLETTRVISQASNERNYHVFYQVFTDEELKERYSLTKPEDYHFTSQGNCFKVEGQQPIDDKQEMNDVKLGMEKLGFSSDEILWFYKIVCAVLHLGNVNFELKKSGDGGCKIRETDNSELHFKKLSEILEIDSDKLSSVMLTRSIRTSKDVTIKNLSLKQTMTARDSLAKAIYGRLFGYLIERINESFGEINTGRFIGILDIFGFECFKYNSFEQLCINFTNERLQKLFNQTTFLEEQDMYKMERINFNKVQFIDNQKVLDIIDTRPAGIFNLLDDECKAPRSSVETLLRRINGQHREKFKLFKSYPESATFEIKHFAATVRYNVNDFIYKNKDALNQDIYEVCSNSTDVYTNVLFPPMKSFEKVKIKSTSGRFRSQLSELMTVLEDTQCHFIRCIKPNDEQVANNFNGRKIKTQLDSSAIVDAVSTRKQGFAHKMFHENFFLHYRSVNGFRYKYDTSRKDKALCKDVITKCFDMPLRNLPNIQIGETRVLFKTEEFKFLELNKTISILESVITIQAYFRGKQTRKFVLKYREIKQDLEEAVKNKDLVKIEEIEANLGKMGKRYQITSRKLEIAKKKIRQEKMWEPVKKKLVKYDTIRWKKDKESGDVELDEGVIESLDEDDMERVVNSVLEVQEKSKIPVPADVKYTLNKMKTLKKLLTSHKLNKELDDLMDVGEGEGEEGATGQVNKKSLRRNEVREMKIQMTSPEEFAKQEKAKAIEYIETEGVNAIKNLDRDALINMASRAAEFQYESTMVTKIRDLLKIPEIEFLKKQIERMNETSSSTGRKQNKKALFGKSIELKEAVLIEDYDKFKFFYKLSTLRNPPEEVPGFGCFCIPYKTIIREQTLETAKEIYGDSAENRLYNKKRKFLIWQADDFLYFSLLRLPNDLEDMAFECFEKVFAYMEEYRSEEDGLSLIKTGVFKGGGKNPGLRNEIFTQIIKQLTRNPTAESRIRGVELLGLCVASFPPDDEEFENFLYVWMRLHLPYPIYKNYMTAVYSIQFNKKSKKYNGANPRIKQNTDLSEIRLFLDEAREESKIIMKDAPEKWLIPDGSLKNILGEYDIDEDFLNAEEDIEVDNSLRPKSFRESVGSGAKSAKEIRKSKRALRKKTIRSSHSHDSASASASELAFALDVDSEVDEEFVGRKSRKSQKKESLHFSTAGGESIQFAFENKKKKKTRRRTGKKAELKAIVAKNEKIDTTPGKKSSRKSKKTTRTPAAAGESLLELSFTNEPQL